MSRRILLLDDPARQALLHRELDEEQLPHLLRGVVAVPSSVILSAAADCTPLLAHHLEPLLLLQGSTCLIR